MRKKLLSVFFVCCLPLFVSYNGFKQEAYAKDIYINEQTIEYIEKKPKNIEKKQFKEIGIFIDDEHIKHTYDLYEELDLKNLKVYVELNNNTRKEILDYSITDVDLSTYGTKEIFIKYKDFEKSFCINVTFNISDVDDYFMFCNNSTNFRDGPGEDFSEVLTVSTNTKVLVEGIVNNEWARIKYNDNIYFCHLSCLSKERIRTALDDFDFSSSCIIIEGDLDEASLIKAIELYSLIPSNVINAINNFDYKIMLSNNSLYTQGHAGIYWPMEMNDYRYIAVYATSESKVNMAILHETGHFIDNYLGYQENWGITSFYYYKGVTSDDAWVQIYNEEVNLSNFPSWATNCPEEYFAECVWKVLTNPSWCQKTIPKSYEYVLNCINRC